MTIFDRDLGRLLEDADDAGSGAPAGDAGAGDAAKPTGGEPAAGGDGDEFKGGNVPYDRFKALRDERDADRRELERLRREEEKRKRDAMSEQERVAAERAEALEKASAAEARAARLERESYIFRAATAAGFADPDDAATFLGGDEKITDASSAKKAVEALLEAKPHLAGSGGSGPRSIGAPRRDGGGEQPTPKLGKDGQPEDPQEFDRAFGRDLARGLGLRRSAS